MVYVMVHMMANKKEMGYAMGYYMYYSISNYTYTGEDPPEKSQVDAHNLKCWVGGYTELVKLNPATSGTPPWVWDRIVLRECLQISQGKSSPIIYGMTYCLPSGKQEDSIVIFQRKL